MASRPQRRKRVRYYHQPGNFHELTYSCYRRMPLLTNNRWRAMLSQAITAALERHAFHLAAFVYMPEHVHLLVYPVGPAAMIENLLRAIKRPFSYRIKQLLEASSSPLLEKLTIRQRPGVMTFRFWQEGPGYDRNLFRPRRVLESIDYLHNNPVRRGLVESAISWRWSSIRMYAEENPAEDPELPVVHGLPPEFFDLRET